MSYELVVFDLGITFFRFNFKYARWRMWEGEFVIYGIFYILCSLANARVCM